MNQTPVAPSQPVLDDGLTIALAQASKAAYDYYSGTPFTPPAGYRQVDAWTGWDEFLFTGSEEKYGLVFQSTVDAGAYIFAFRGTDSDMDAYEDVHFLTTDFVPSAGSVQPVPRVASGFYGIYNDQGGAMTQSMRGQLFALIDKYQPRRIYVTGHSLGAALCQLFTLDLEVSRAIASININFSSPMVGTDTWRVAYANTIAGGSSIRVYNYWDYVPALPPSNLGYTHVGSGFRTAFYVRGEWYPHILSRHSIVNLTTVLSNALPLRPQQWVGTFPDFVDTSMTMVSTVPPSGIDIPWADRVGGYMAAESALR